MKKHGFLDSRQVNLTIAESGPSFIPAGHKGDDSPFPSPRTFPFYERTASKKRTRPQASFIPLCVLLFPPPFVYFPLDFSTSIPALRFHHLTPAMFALPQDVFLYSYTS